MGDVLELSGATGIIEIHGSTTDLLELTRGTSEVLELVTRGPQGPAGPPGAAGTVFVQPSPSSTWVIPHTLGRPPVLLLLNAAGKRIYGDEYPSDTSVTVIYSTPVAGKAVLI